MPVQSRRKRRMKSPTSVTTTKRNVTHIGAGGKKTRVGKGSKFTPGKADKRPGPSNVGAVPMSQVAKQSPPLSTKSAMANRTAASFDKAKKRSKRKNTVKRGR